MVIMRILHTGDFHAGRQLRGMDRTPEIRAALSEILSIARDSKADAVLVSGDVFDTVNPSAYAEDVVYEFYLGLREAGIPSVTIAGNHDSSERLRSIRGLLKQVGAHMVTHVTPNLQDLVYPVQARDGTLLQVLAFPFLSERKLVKLADIAEGNVSQWRQKYQEGMNFFLRRMASYLRPDAVNMLMMHLTFDGSLPSGSERSFTFDITNSYTVSARMLPEALQYVALGHIHKPQQVSELPPAYYAGSIIQLDFGEAGEQKYVNLIEAEPGRPIKFQQIPLQSGKRLKTVRVKLDQIEQMDSLNAFDGLLRVIVELPAGMGTAGLKERVAKVLPSALAIEIEASQQDLKSRTAGRSNLSDVELFEQYYLERHGALPAEVKEAFLEASRWTLEGEEP
ncbi:nuclease SbcCD subunit D [Deinococcus roseus]|uniref:Nuclease SbcCD subunit D n=2 Tax=Deinococcus roseus TaxID=392414 RepID=A0ABQ2D872_9DEIO|nr:nuclease SbcCD subunit D [Deinococcus roseus]